MRASCSWLRGGLSSFFFFFFLTHRMTQLRLCVQQFLPPTFNLVQTLARTQTAFCLPTPLFACFKFLIILSRKRVFVPTQRRLRPPTQSNDAMSHARCSYSYRRGIIVSGLRAPTRRPLSELHTEAVKRKASQKLMDLKEQLQCDTET